MARHKKILLEPASDPNLDISSLIDVCFLLLIYFLVTSTIVPEEKELGMQLPPTVTDLDLIPSISPMFIRVDASGVVFSGSREAERIMDTDISDRDLPNLSSQLKLYSDAARSAGDNPLVRIMVDGETTQQRVMDVLNALEPNRVTTIVFDDIVEM